jgi:hypothetical protein
MTEDAPNIDIANAINPSYDVVVAIDGEIEIHENKTLKEVIAIVASFDGVIVAGSDEIRIEIRKVHDGAPEIAQALYE